jgi:hypothetical protein
MPVGVAVDSGAAAWTPGGVDVGPDVGSAVGASKGVAANVGVSGSTMVASGSVGVRLAGGEAVDGTQGVSMIGGSD